MKKQGVQDWLPTESKQRALSANTDAHSGLFVCFDSLHPGQQFFRHVGFMVSYQVEEPIRIQRVNLISVGNRGLWYSKEVSC